MNKIFLSFMIIALIFGLNSCTKTGPVGPAGPAGPLSSGSITGAVVTLDQYGFKILGQEAGVQVMISDSANDTTTTNSAGIFTFHNIKTGTYTYTFSKPGFGTIMTFDRQFLGGGTTDYGAQNLSMLPTFSLFNVSDTIEVVAGDTGVLVRGMDSASEVATRYYAVFIGSGSSVSNNPGNYNIAITPTGGNNVIAVGPTHTTWSYFIPDQQLNDAGFAAGSTAYIVVYPIAAGAPTYVDLTTGKTVYSAVGSPSSVLSVIVP